MQGTPLTLHERYPLCLHVMLVPQPEGSAKLRADGNIARYICSKCQRVFDRDEVLRLRKAWEPYQMLQPKYWTEEEMRAWYTVRLGNNVCFFCHQAVNESPLASVPFLGDLFSQMGGWWRCNNACGVWICQDCFDPTVSNGRIACPMCQSWGFSQPRAFVDG